MNELNFKDSTGLDLNISVMGFFSVPALEKEYIMYSMMDSDPNNQNAAVLLGEVLREGNNITVLGIKKEEQKLVVAYYNEISNQLGGE